MRSVKSRQAWTRVRAGVAWARPGRAKQGRSAGSSRSCVRVRDLTPYLSHPYKLKG